jgi:hypothetical protein
MEIFHEVIDKYRKYIYNKLNSGEITLEDVKKLKGKNLGCWCKTREKGKDNLCHGDVLLEVINQVL